MNLGELCVALERLLVVSMFVCISSLHVCLIRETDRSIVFNNLQLIHPAIQIHFRLSSPLWEYLAKTRVSVKCARGDALIASPGQWLWGSMTG